LDDVNQVELLKVREREDAEAAEIVDALDLILSVSEDLPLVLGLVGKQSCFNSIWLYGNKVCPTLPSTSAENRQFYHFEEPIRINETEIRNVSTFPQDYQSPHKDIGWLCGMSVPPVMTAQISYQIYKQWLSKINK
jgi:hypothetical protein